MRRVLFVDDDAAVLSGLRRMLHPMRSQWQMTFVTDGHMALSALALEPADVVVVDMQMRGMDGATLLAEVRRHWPGTARFVLSGFADKGSSLRTVSVAHRFLSKPCDPATLVAAITSGCELQDRLARPELRRLVGGLDALPSAPHTYTEITEALGRPDVSLDLVADIIEHDAGCSAKLLQLVNSAFFGLARSMSRVREAVTYLGVSRVRDVVLAAEISNAFRCATPEQAALVQEINEYSLSVAGTAREQAPATYAHDAFVAGVLHDVGRVTLATVLPEQYLPIDRESRHPEADLTRSEIEQLGASHAEVGAYLLRLWGLPFPLVEVVARHHDPDAATDPNPVLAAVSAAVPTHPVTPDCYREGVLQ